MSQLGLAEAALKATRSCLATTGLAVWMLRVGDKRRGRGSGVVSDGERTAGVSIRDWRRFARAARGVVERVAASSTPPFPERTRLDFEPEPPPIFFFFFNNAHLASQEPHITASSAQHTRVAGAAVHTSQKVFMSKASEGRWSRCGM